MTGDFARALGEALRRREARGRARRPIPRPRPADPRRRDRSRALRLATVWTGGVMSLTILTVSGYGWVVTDAVDAATVRADVFGGLDGRPKDSPATDILIVGSDTRAGLSQDARDQLHAGSAASADGARSDTMILAQLAADHQSLTLLSIPRDSYVGIPAWRTHPAHHDKINSALNLGGPGLAVATVEQNTGIHIDHFVQVDFAAFAKIVDALDGVDVCLPKAANDPLSGLDLPAGVSHVGGVQALAFVRARYTLTGGSDLGRIHRQQEFLGSLAARAASSGVVADPAKLAELVRAVAASVQTDSELDTEGMLKLALAVKSVPRDRIRFVSMPLSDVDHQVPLIGSTVQWDPALAGNLFQALRQDQPMEQVEAESQAKVRAQAQAQAAADAAAAPPTLPIDASAADPADGASTTPPAPAAKRKHVKPTGPQPLAMSVHTAEQNICH
jgi:LCP family protein required for cell wall assembly